MILSLIYQLVFLIFVIGKGISEVSVVPVDNPFNSGLGPYTFDYLLGEKSNYTTTAQVMFLDFEDTTKNTISSLKNQGKIVICYVSVGSFEDWRSDSNTFPKSVIGNKYPGWQGEYWLDIRNISILLPIMTKRFQLAQSKGCQGIDPDNMDVYSQEDTGFKLTYDDQLHYNKIISIAVHKLGMVVGLKNDNDQIDDNTNGDAFVNYFDFAVSESCFSWEECYKYQPFYAKNSPVFDVEYSDDPSNTITKKEFLTKVCTSDNKIAFILKQLVLKNDPQTTVTCP